ncbi:MAG: glycosyltransferase [Kangiellaceae bacterium]|nr:glycosyltransferase [Kangiellaceae bacterium]
MGFSFIIPLYNKQASVAKTINSILQQSVRDFEIIVVDDGSTDESHKVAEQFVGEKLRLLRQENAGVSVARNTGTAHAKFGHLVFIDADDLIAKDFLLHIQSLINRYPQAGAFGTKYQYSRGNKNTPCKIFSVKDEAVLINDYFYVASRGDLPIVASGICIPKNVLEVVGGFPVGQKQGEDQDLWSRIGLNYSIAVHPSIDISYVLDAENRVSVDSIPFEELEYSRNLQSLLNENLVQNERIESVQRYIAGHLLHLVQLNAQAGKHQVASNLLNDKRTRRLPLRRLKWSSYLKMKQLFSRGIQEPDGLGNNRQPLIENLLNDKKMGGILSVVKSLSKSELANNYRFNFSVVNPKSWLRKNYATDIVMVHYASSWSTLLPNLITRLCNPSSRLILQEHHYTLTFEQSVPSVKRFHWMLRLNYKIFDRVIAVSHGQGSWIRERQLIQPNKLTIIPQCRELSDFLKLKQKEVGKPIKLAAYGRLCPAKGFSNLIEAFNQVNHPQLKLSIAGDGPSENELKNKAGNNTNIEFVGRIEDVPKFLQQCDLVVIPSVSEAFGLVCLEAKAAGKAVLVSDIDGLSEQVNSPGENCLPPCGLLLEDLTPQAIVKALIQIPHLPLSEWGDNGRLQVKNAWEVYQADWRNLFKKLVK